MSEQDTLFDAHPEWRKHWDESMPEFEQSSLESFDHIRVHFADAQARRDFLILMGENPARRKSIWYPKQEYLKMSTPPPDDVQIPANRYPIYVISKGRWDSRMTAKALDKLGIPYHIVVEPQERDEYAAHIPTDKILTLPFSNLGQGSIPARNWVWEHSMSVGAERHWILDDNIEGFYQLNKNIKKKCVDVNPFAATEDLSDRYVNVALSGLNYEMFVPRRVQQPPYRLNTRVYSCILILNSLPYRWRGRYNEDTDLSIRVLKDGWCTILLNAFSCNKAPTMTMAGGNTDQLYKDDGRLLMAQSLQEQHPDVVTVTQKWGRAQHQVNYRAFRFNELKEKPAQLNLGEE